MKGQAETGRARGEKRPQRLGGNGGHLACWPLELDRETSLVREEAIRGAELGDWAILLGGIRLSGSSFHWRLIPPAQAHAQAQPKHKQQAREGA